MTLTETMMEYLSQPEAHQPLQEAAKSYELLELASLPLLQCEELQYPDWFLHSEAATRRMALGSLWALERTAVSAGGENLDRDNAGRLLMNVWHGVARDEPPGSGKQDALLRAALAAQLVGMPSVARALAASAGSLDPLSFGLQAVLSALLQKRIHALREISMGNETTLVDAIRLDTSLGHQALWVGESLCFKGFSIFAELLLQGRTKLLPRAFSSVRKGMDVLEDAGFVVETNTVRATLQIMQSIWNTSTWKCLASQSSAPIWTRYLSMLARGSLKDPDGSGVVELWRSQQEAVLKGLLGAKDIVVKVPTGAGKTLAAELAIVEGFSRNPNSKCLYIAPFRALADEVLASLSTHLSALGYQVAEDLGFQGPIAPLGDVSTHNTDVLIATPERARMLLGVDPSFFQNASTIILDELHLATDAGNERGALYEMLLARLTRSCPAARFVGLSAVLSDDTLADMAAWLSNNHGEKAPTVSSSWHPTESEILECYWPEHSSEGELVLWQDISQSKPSAEPMRLGTIEKLSLRPSTSGRRPLAFPANNNGRQNLTVLLASIFAQKGQVLIYCPQRGSLRGIAASLELLQSRCDEHLRKRPDEGSSPSPELLASFAEWYGPDQDERRWLEMGFAIHHALLPPTLRLALEEDFRKHRLWCLITTSTLSAGVNLPVDTIIFHSTNRFDRRADRSIPIRPEEFWNAAGRAGRPSQLEPGRVVFVSSTPEDRRMLRFFLDNKDDKRNPLESTLLKALRDNDFRQVSNVLDLEAMSILFETENREELEVASEQSWRSTLAHVEAVRQGVNAGPILAFIHDLEDGLITRNLSRDTLSAWSQTGLSAATCAQLDAATGEVSIQDIFTADTKCTSSSALKTMLPYCLGTHECNPHAEDSGRLSVIAMSWFAGASPAELDNLMSEEFPSKGRDRTLEMLHETIQYRLPWVLTGLITICSQRLSTPLAELPECLKYLPSMIRLGLPSPEACHLASAGIRSRKSILELERAFFEEKSVSEINTDIVDWLATPLGRRQASKSGVPDEELRRASLSHELSHSNAIRLEPGKSDYLPQSFIVPVNDRIAEALLSANLGAGSELELRHKQGAVEIVCASTTLGHIPHPWETLVALDLDIGRGLKAEFLGITLPTERQTTQVSIRLYRPDTLS